MIAGIGVVGHNVSSSTELPTEHPNNLLYNYLEKDVVVERAVDDGNAANYQTIATLASASATQSIGYEIDTPASEETPEMVTSFQGQVMTKTASTETDEINYQRVKEMTYSVRAGETLSQIAAKFDLKLSTILWENGLHDQSVIKDGDTLTILPVDGVRHKITADDTLDGIVEKYKGDKELVIAFNHLENEQLPAEGTYLTIPDGIDPDPVRPPEPEPSVAPTPVRVAAVSTPVVRYTGGGHRFPYGWCTYWAALKYGSVPWSGNANAWPSNARAYGYATGKTPRAGAIYAEPWLTGYGHVSYVEHVNADGSFTVSEMNYAGWGRVSYRTIGYPSGVFIY